MRIKLLEKNNYSLEVDSEIKPRGQALNQYLIIFERVYHSKQLHFITEYLTFRIPGSFESLHTYMYLVKL